MGFRCCLVEPGFDDELFLLKQSSEIMHRLRLLVLEIKSLVRRVRKSHENPQYIDRLEVWCPTGSSNVDPLCLFLVGN